MILKLKRTQFQISEMILVMQTHPVINDLMTGSLNIPLLGKLKLPILYDGLAQHYGINTEYLDLTNNIWKAVFFASAKYLDGKYYPYEIKEDSTELNKMPQCPISTNVFYRHYYWLSENSGLPEGVESFRDYLEDMFELEESDAFDKDYETIATGVVESILQEDFSIDIDATPCFENGLDEVQELYRQVLKDNLCDDKPYKALINDSLEYMVLFNQPMDKPEPFFLTWDKSFGFMRSAYKRKYKRGSSSLFFHLFSPAKFVNHVDLVDFKVNANTLSDDLLSLIESHNYKQTTYNVIDTINRFLDIPDISPEKRKAYIKKIQKEIYQDDSFSYEQSEIEQQESTNKKSFAFISQELFNHYKDNGQGYTRSYRNMLLDEDSFEKFIAIISEYLNNKPQS